MKVYIVVRNTEDSEMNSVDVFQSVHLKEEDADIKLAQLERVNAGDPGSTFEILERNI